MCSVRYAAGEEVRAGRVARVHGARLASAAAVLLAVAALFAASAGGDKDGEQEPPRRGDERMQRGRTIRSCCSTGRARRPTLSTAAKRRGGTGNDSRAAVVFAWTSSCTGLPARALVAAREAVVAVAAGVDAPGATADFTRRAAMAAGTAVVGAGRNRSCRRRRKCYTSRSASSCCSGRSWARSSRSGSAGTPVAGERRTKGGVSGEVRTDTQDKSACASSPRVLRGDQLLAGGLAAATSGRGSR